VRIVLDANLIAALVLQLPYAPAVDTKMLSILGKNGPLIHGQNGPLKT
jgi:hypothetical protein